MASKPVALWLGYNDGSSGISGFLDGNPVDRNISIGLMVLGICVLAGRRISWGMLLSRNRFLCLFYLYLLFSVLWSDAPVVAFKRYMREMGNLIMILVILTEADPIKAGCQVFLRCAYLLIPLSVLYVKYFPEHGVYYDFWSYKRYCCGVATEKNGLGRLAMFSALVLMWRLSSGRASSSVFKRRWIDAGELAVLVMCLWLLRVSCCATSLMCFVLGAVALFSAPRLRTRPKWLIGAAWGAIVVSFLFLTVSGFRELATGSLGRRSDLTERTLIWEQALKLGTNPLIGAGFGSVWLSGKGRIMAEEWILPHAHNGYLETYLNSGLIGVCLLLAVLFLAARNALRQAIAGSPVGYLYSAIFLIGFIYNYTETAITNDSLVAFGMLLIATNYPFPEEVQSTSRIEDLDAVGAVQEGGF